jgi:hypothetical protein
MKKTRTPRECEICGLIFEPATALVKKGYGRFCTSKCYGKWLAKTCDTSKMKEIGAKRKNFVCSEITKQKISLKNIGRKRPDISGDKCHRSHYIQNLGLYLKMGVLCVESVTKK